MKRHLFLTLLFIVVQNVESNITAEEAANKFQHQVAPAIPTTSKDCQSIRESYGKKRKQLENQARRLGDQARNTSYHNKEGKKRRSQLFKESSEAWRERTKLHHMQNEEYKRCMQQTRNYKNAYSFYEGRKKRNIEDVKSIVIHTIGGYGCAIKDKKGKVIEAPNEKKFSDKKKFKRELKKHEQLLKQKGTWTHFGTWGKSAKQWQNIFWKRGKNGHTPHWIIGRNKEGEELVVPEIFEAFHTVGANPNSIGIELMYEGKKGEKFDKGQIENLKARIRRIKQKWPNVKFLQAHSDVDKRKEKCGGKLFNRREDPGPNFPWEGILNNTQLERKK